jgi:hypothetical protein
MLLAQDVVSIARQMIIEKIINNLFINKLPLITIIKSFYKTESINSSVLCCRWAAEYGLLDFPG